MNLQNNKELVFQSVAQAAEQAQRLKDSVNIIAVTKYVDCETTQELVRTGIQHIGENRVDKFLDKYHALKDENLTWHLIGSLQRRKVKDVINYVDYFHALDSVKLAKEIDKRAEHVIKCFLQVNISKEESKHGFLIEELESVIGIEEARKRKKTLAQRNQRWLNTLSRIMELSFNEEALKPENIKTSKNELIVAKNYFQNNIYDQLEQTDKHIPSITRANWSPVSNCHKNLI